MPSGSGRSFDDLPPVVRGLLDTTQRAVLSTIDRLGAPHVVPVVFALLGAEIILPIDHKPKEGVKLSRVSNIERDPRVTLLLDHYDDDWTRLAWLMVRGKASIDVAPDPVVTGLLNERYSQYESAQHHDAVIRLHPTKLSWWTWT